MPPLDDECADCLIRAVEVSAVEVGDTILIDNIQFGVRTGDAWAVVDASTPWGIWTVDHQTGQLLDYWEARGQGPGEVQLVFGLASVGDSVYVADSMNGRITVLYRGMPVRTIVADAPIHQGGLGVFPDGRAVVSLSDGRVAVESNGRMSPVAELGETTLRWVGADETDEGVVLAEIDRFQILLVDAGSAGVDVLVDTSAAPSWFGDPSEIVPMGTGEVGPILLGSHRDERGRVWVFVRRPDERARQPGSDPLVQDRFFDTHILVYSPTGGLLADLRVDEFLSVPTSEGAISKRVDPATGVAAHSIWSFTLDSESTR